MSYTKYWQVIDPSGARVNIFFVTKKSAKEWIAAQPDGLIAEYIVKKVSML